jgi:hypothetical protein
MRAALICASFCFLTGCASGPDHNLQLHALGIELAANERAVSFLIVAILLIVIAVLFFRRHRSVRAAHGQSFPDWLAGLPGAATDLQDLKTYASAVHWTSNDLNTLRATIENDGAISQADKVRRASALGTYYDRWQNQPAHQGGRLLAQLLHDVFENGIGIFLSLFALAVFITLAIGLSNSSFFSSLAQVDQARGLITFLVAVCAVAVILLTAINIFWGGDAQFSERFTAAKDLVTLVVGVLGTILGFYFGTLTTDRLLQLSFDSPASYSVVASGSDINVRATARNGASPYNFDLLVVDAEGKPVSKSVDNKQSDNSSIREDIKAPTAPGKYSIILLLRDAKGLQTKASLDFIVKATGDTAMDAAPRPAGTSPPVKPETKPPSDPPPNPNAVK